MKQVLKLILSSGISEVESYISINESLFKSEINHPEAKLTFRSESVF